MASSPRRLDPERRRRRLLLLAAIADNHPTRGARSRDARLRELIAHRRRTGT